MTRVAYSVADLTARAWIIDEIKQAEIAPRIDAAGNIFARFGGQPNQPPILFGSHIDSVPGGGNFDGDLGTFAALEVIQAVQAAKIQTRHPLEMVLWAHEESTAFGIGTAASRIVAGDLQAGDMDQGVERHEAQRCDSAHRRRSRQDRDGRARQGRVACVRRAPHRAGRHAR